MAIEVPKNEEISKGEKNGAKRESVLPCVGNERIRGACTLRNESEEELLREVVAPT